MEQPSRQPNNGHEWTARKQQALGRIRAGLDTARRFIDSLDDESPERVRSETSAPRRFQIPKGKLAAAGIAALLEILARRERKRPPRRKLPAIGKLVVLSATALAVGKLIAARR